MTVDHLFSIASRDELWSGGVLIESRAEHGQARCHGAIIDASDVPDALLIERAEARMAAMREQARELRDARVRLVANARRINDYEREEATMTVTVGGVSVVLIPGALPPSPRRSGERVPKTGEPLPILWRNGSASVLLHEAAGHAAEDDHLPLEWPSWLTIRDEPDFEFDDTGAKTEHADLTSEAPKTQRRASFRDIPLPRMTTLIARQHDAPWSIPEERIEVHLLAGGAFEPLTGAVTLSIAVAELVQRGESVPLAPFQIRVPRERVARAIAGATGEPVRYPGVVCGREGQELVVGSFAPLMLTTELT